MSRPGLLVVEGKSDVDFFHALLRNLTIDLQIQVVPPKELGSHTNTATVVPGLLPRLIDQLDSGVVERIGIVVDADHQSGGGFLPRWKVITDELRRHGYRCPTDPPANPNAGSVFLHDDELPKLGLWLLPDHNRNGMLEDLVRSSVKRDATQDALLRFAEATIAGLPTRLFPESHTSKAIVYSWLSYQRRPALGLASPIMAGLLDYSLQPLAGLMSWLQRTFAGDPLR